MNLSQEEIKVSKSDFLVSKTDLKGKITYCNRQFMQIAGYKEVDLIGKPHNIIRHEDMPKTVFKFLWDNIKQKKEVFAFVKNRACCGRYYWVYANVTASLGDRGEIVGYHSVRRKPDEEAIKVISSIYETLLKIEKTDGVDSALKYLVGVLDEKKLEYNEFIIGLQHQTIRI